MDKIDIVYYINLDHRTDRNTEFLEWIAESGFPISKLERIQAIHTPMKGHLGCLLSHMKTLDTFLKSPFSNCIIFEDDYIPLNTNTFWNNFEKLFNSNMEYDVVLCSYNCLVSQETSTPLLHKVENSMTTSGYLITREFAPTLVEHWNTAFHLSMAAEKAGKNPFPYAADTYWQKLMPSHNWLTFYPRIGRQRPSYSDIMEQNTNYGA